MAAPDVTSYLDYRQFLRDWFDWKKADNPRYSHRLFARRAGVRSPSLLLLVTEGKRNLTAQTLGGFVSALGLDEEETRHFSLLVRADQAETSDERAAALEEVMATKQFREARRIDAAAYRYMIHWWFPAIHELCRRSDFRADPGWVAAQLSPSISEDQAADALQGLLDLGLVAPDADGIPRPAEASIVTPHEVAAFAFQRYHAGMLDRASEAIERFGREERHLLGLTVSIAPELVPTIKERLNELQRELMALCEANPGDRVHQLSVAFFPLSEPPEEPPS